MRRKTDPGVPGQEESENTGGNVMSALAPHTKMLILELQLNDDRSPFELIKTMAEAVHIEAGEQEGLEYVKIMNVRHIKPQKEIANGQRI
jgi:hypothetical protein